ncbi:MAG: DUF4230 domain-containing protein [Eubacteriales bacterium]|nr:DUF4230 domain-containing protein [Eubacteriales bacterium]
MRQPPPNPTPEEYSRPRRRRFRPRRFVKRFFLLLICLALTFLAVRFGPDLYRRFIGDGNTTWVSERFSEEMAEKNELVVYQTTLTGQETVAQEAWLLGTVQKVAIPYSFSLSFAVDLSLAKVRVDTATDTIVVLLPSPVAKYPKLTVDETQVQKNDWLYPLTPERYAEMKNEIEQKLYDECATKQEYLDAAWQTAVKDMETLFSGIASTSRDGVTCTITILRDDNLSAPTAEPDATPSPAPSPTA